MYLNNHTDMVLNKCNVSDNSKKIAMFSYWKGKNYHKAIKGQAGTLYNFTLVNAMQLYLS